FMWDLFLMTGTDIRETVSRIGFGDFMDVQLRLTIADLFPKSSRCGLYAMHFANGEGYIGRTINIVQRFHGHRGNHDDIVALSFRPLPARDQDREERAAIAACEASGVHLRNIQFASFMTSESNDLDLILPLEEQNAWLQDSAAHCRSTERPDDADLRRRYRSRF
ncbi:MAG: hypothetical protein ACLPSF_01110, partial [Methylocella sp.]